MKHTNDGDANGRGFGAAGSRALVADRTRPDIITILQFRFCEVPHRPQAFSSQHLTHGTCVFLSIALTAFESLRNGSYVSVAHYKEQRSPYLVTPAALGVFRCSSILRLAYFSDLGT